MQKLNSKILLKLCLAFLIFYAGASFAAGDIIEGKHYKKLSSKLRNGPLATEFRAQDKGKTQILIFFSYGCYWCGKVNKPIDQWAEKKRDNVSIHFIPVSFNRFFEVLAKAFYTAEALDDTGKIDDDIFYGIHEQRINYARVKLLANLFKTHGIKKEIFEQTFNSFAIGIKVSKAKEISKAYKISATPNIIINGAKKSYITNLAACGEVPILIQTIEYLVDKEKK